MTEKCKQCVLKKDESYTYRWVISSIAVEGNKVTLGEEKWTVIKVWHREEDKKFVYRVVEQ